MVTHFEKYASTGNEFIKKVATELGKPEDKGQAFRITRCVLHALRERITTEESMNLISQLPAAIKTIYIDGWKLSRKQTDYKTVEDFLDAIRQEENFLAANKDFGNDTEAKVQAVFKVLKQYAGEGEMNDIRGQLPKPIATLVDV